LATILVEDKRMLPSRSDRNCLFSRHHQNHVGQPSESMKPYTPAAFICLALLFDLSVRGDTADPKPAPIGVTVAEVTDIRAAGTQPSECRLVLSLTGDAVADAYSLHQVRVTKAVDELGRDLTKPVGGTIRLADTFSYSPVEEQQRLEAVAAEVARRRELRDGLASSGTVTPVAALARPQPSSMRPTISVRNPSRQSATIRLIEGEIELFTPTEANGGILRLPEITAQPAEFVSNAALTDAGGQLMYLTPDTYEAKRRAAGADAREPTSPWSDNFAGYLNAQVRQSNVSHRPMAYFFVLDPRREIVDLELQTPDGKPLGLRVSSGIGQLRALYLSQPPPPDAQLLVHLASPRALASYPFKLENIALP
jgi:hypothetical protein